MGYLSYVWDVSLMFWKKLNHMSPGCNYGGVYCLMYGILVLCLGYLSYVWDICLMYGAVVLRIGYLMYGMLVLCLGKNEITCHLGATMAECIVLCMGY